MKAHFSLDFFVVLALTMPTRTIDYCQGTFVGTVLQRGEQTMLHLVVDKPHRYAPKGTVEVRITAGQEFLPEGVVFGGETARVDMELNPPSLLGWKPGPPAYKCSGREP